MTFKDIYDNALDLAGEDKVSPDTVSLSVVKNGINEGMMILAVRTGRYTKTETGLTASSLVQLPDDFIEAFKVMHSTEGELMPFDYGIHSGHMRLMPPLDLAGTIDIAYSAYPQAMVNDTDVAPFADQFLNALACYGGYFFSMHRKKYSAAAMFLDEFNSIAMGQG